MNHHAEEQWGVLLAGSGTRIQDGQSVAVEAGDLWCTPAHVEHGFKAGPHGARVLDIFALPRDAYKSAGSGFGNELDGAS